MTAAYAGDYFYCDVASLRVEYESGTVLSLTSQDDALTLDLLVVKHLAGRVLAANGAAAVLTNLGDYQDSKHLHFHVSAASHCPDLVGAVHHGRCSRAIQLTLTQWLASTPGAGPKALPTSQTA